MYDYLRQQMTNGNMQPDISMGLTGVTVIGSAGATLSIMWHGIGAIVTQNLTVILVIAVTGHIEWV